MDNVLERFDTRFDCLVGIRVQLILNHNMFESSANCLPLLLGNNSGKLDTVAGLPHI